MSPCCVTTTINPPTEAVKAWEQRFGHRLIVIGDRKTPADWACGTARYLSVDHQKNLPLESLRFVPENHYARKNIGYLHAMLLGAGSIFDTDDDNAPEDGFSHRQEHCLAEMVESGSWCNIYFHFKNSGSGFIWPRGTPLTQVGLAHPSTREISLDFPIQQCLVNGDPDTDAIWRLTRAEAFEFTKKRTIGLAENVWCPFNSQATWWFPDAYPLMYLPIHATFRMTDIWRSFVAQRCLWAMGRSVVFNSPAEVVQERNPHDLMADFTSELPGYQHNEKIAAALEKLSLQNGDENGKKFLAENMRMCYSAMIDLGVLPKEELASLDAWLADVKRVKRL